MDITLQIREKIIDTRTKRERVLGEQVARSYFNGIILLPCCSLNFFKTIYTTVNIIPERTGNYFFVVNMNQFT